MGRQVRNRIAFRKRSTSLPRTTLALLVSGTLAMPFLSYAQKKGEYSAWFATSSPLIQYRWRALSYGSPITPDCDMDVRYQGETVSAEVKATITYMIRGERKRQASYYLQFEKTSPDITSGCDYITDFHVDKIVESRHYAKRRWRAFCGDRSHGPGGWDSPNIVDSQAAAAADAKEHEHRFPSHTATTMELKASELKE